MFDKFKKIVSDAPHGKGFYTDFGEIKSLKELKNTIAERGTTFYFSYVNKESNHFANWVEKVFDDKHLADQLRNADSNEKVLKAIDDRTKYAELWLNYNTDKELLNHYLTNGELSLKNKINCQDFEPEHHRFETVFDIDLRSITRTSPPKTTNIIQNFASSFQKKQPEDIPESEVMKNAVELPGTYKLRQKEAVDSEKEKAAFSYLEKLFPGVKSTAVVEKKGFFDRLISFFWK